MDREARTYATAWANELASTLSEDARALERRLFGDEGGASERGEDEDEDASEEETVGTSGRKGKARADARVRRKTRRDWSHSMSCLAYCFLNLPVSSSMAGGNRLPRSFGLAPFGWVVIFILYDAIHPPSADVFFGSAEVAM